MTVNSSSYNYRYYMDLSEATEQKGLDCSGFVGWSVYQIMQSRSGGPMYTDVSGNLGSLYSGKGMGTVVSQAQLASSNWKLYPGDIGYNSGHTWIVLGQCSDKSVVILHCTPNAAYRFPEHRHQAELTEARRSSWQKLTCPGILEPANMTIMNPVVTISETVHTSDGTEALFPIPTDI